MQEEPVPKSEFSIHPATRMGHVHHTVADLNRQIEFYQKVIGLKLHWRNDATAGLGVGEEDLLRLTEVRGARRFRGTTGMYHFALLLPNRRELARAIARLFELRYPNHPTDHLMTKTTYLDDPEGNNIEIYTDTPEDGYFGFVDGAFVARHANGALSNGREPLDVEALFRELSSDDRLDLPMPKETKIGHVHLYVANLKAAMHFYHEVVGFGNMGIADQFQMGMVSAGGYHHHLGFNTWVGEGAPPPPPDALGLRHFTVVVPDDGELAKIVERVGMAGISVEESQAGFVVRDPSQNKMLLTSKTNLANSEVDSRAGE